MLVCHATTHVIIVMYTYVKRARKLQYRLYRSHNCILAAPESLSLDYFSFPHFLQVLFLYSPSFDSSIVDIYIFIIELHYVQLISSCIATSGALLFIGSSSWQHSLSTSGSRWTLLKHDRRRPRNRWYVMVEGMRLNITNPMHYSWR